MGTMVVAGSEKGVMREMRSLTETGRIERGRVMRGVLDVRWTMSGEEESAVRRLLRCCRG
jgi:hypothetical protein